MLFDALTNTTEPVMGFPAIPRNLGKTTMPEEESIDPIEILVEGFKPKKAGFLDRFLDNFLVNMGGKPVREQRIKEDNMRAAMEGFTSDPLNAIRRIAQINPEAAWTLYDKYLDNTRADSIAKRQEDVASMKYMGRLGGMLRAIQTSKDPADQYTRMLPNIKRYAERYGLPLEDLPEEYNDEVINAYVMRNVDVEDQIRQEQLDAYRTSRLNQMQQSIDNTNEYRQERLKDFDNAEAGRNARAAQAEAGRNTRATKGQGRVIQTPNGPGILSSDGNHLGIIINGKKTIWQKTGVSGGKSQWKRIQ